MARLHVVVDTPSGVADVDTLALEAQLAAVAREWGDDLHDAFVDALGEEHGVERYRAWRDAFPPAYQDEVTAADAVRDVDVLEHLDPDGDLQLRLEPPNGDEVAHIKLYRAGGPLVLSDVMPLLEHLGVTVVDEHPYEIAAPDGPRRHLLVRCGGRGGRSARRSGDADARRRRVPRGVGGHGRERRAEPAGAARGARGARRRDRARALPVPAPGRGALHRRLPRRHAARQRRGGAADRGVLPRPTRSRARAGRRSRPSMPRSRRASPTSSVAPSTRSSASTPIASCARCGRSWARRSAPTRTGVSRTWRASSIRPLLDFLPRPKPQHEIWVASPAVEGVHLRGG